MRCRPLIFAAALAAPLTIVPALGCGIAVGISGQLKLSSDAQTLGSEVGVATPATVTTLLGLLEGATIDVAAPTVTQSPSGYNAGQQQVQVAYTAAVLGLLTVKNQGYTSSATSFPTGVLGAVTLTITVNNRIINPASFAAGTYQTRTLVTCRP
jgi:hypothetical protein